MPGDTRSKQSFAFVGKGQKPARFGTFSARAPGPPQYSRGLSRSCIEQNSSVTILCPIKTKRTEREARGTQAGPHDVPVPYHSLSSVSANLQVKAPAGFCVGPLSDGRFAGQDVSK